MPSFAINRLNVVAMKIQINMRMFLFVFALFLFSNCSEENSSSPMDIKSVEGVYEGDNLRVSYETNVDVAFFSKVIAYHPDSIDSSITGIEIPSEFASQKIILEMEPLWPYISDYSSRQTKYFMEADVVSTSEQMSFEGTCDRVGYSYKVKGTIAEDNTVGRKVMDLEFRYACKSSFVGKKYVFDFSKESLDYSFLLNKVQFVEWNGEQIPTETFVTDALSPVLQMLKKRLGGELCLEFQEDGSTFIGIREEGSNEFVAIPGKHGFHYEGVAFFYLMADEEGALWISKHLSNSFNIDTELYVYDYVYRLLPVYFGVDSSATEAKIAFELPSMDRFCRMLYRWMNLEEMTEERTLTDEEIAKARQVALMLSEDQLGMICLKAVAE